MSEKRFKKSMDMNGNDEIYDNNTEFYFKIDGALEKLNEFNDEIEQLKEINQELELENLKHIGNGEWDTKDITCMHGKFRLEEWGERYHQFYEGDEKLEDEEVVSLLFENEQLKSSINKLCILISEKNKTTTEILVKLINILDKVD